MKNKIEQLEIKKLIQEYNFLLLDDEYKKELIAEGRDGFMEKVNDMKRELGISSTPPPSPPPEEEQKPKEKKPKVDPDVVDKTTKDKVKKIYRDIAKKTHPDRIGSDEYLDLYMRATKAADEFDLFELFFICNELDIEVVIDLSDKGTLNALIQAKKDELKNIEASFIWLWLHAKNEDEQNNLVKIFVGKHGTNT